MQEEHVFIQNSVGMDEDLEGMPFDRIGARLLHSIVPDPDIEIGLHSSDYLVMNSERVQSRLEWVLLLNTSD